MCIYSTVVTLLLVLGNSKKSYGAIGGAIASLLLTGIVLVTLDRILGLTGMYDGETFTIVNIFEGVDMRALLFASILIGSVGAIMDVATSIASSLSEIQTVGKRSFRENIKSGFNIGRDTLGTMLNTLILAYIGGYLSTVLFFSITTSSFIQLLNEERIIVEFLRAIVGSLGIFLAIPLTTVICAFLFNKKEKSL